MPSLPAIAPSNAHDTAKAGLSTTMQPLRFNANKALGAPRQGQGLSERHPPGTRACTQPRNARAQAHTPAYTHTLRARQRARYAHGYTGVHALAIVGVTPTQISTKI